MKFKVRDKSGNEFKVEEIEDVDKSMGTYSGYSIKQNVDGHIYVLKKSGEKQFFESWKKAHEAIKTGAIKDEDLTYAYADDDDGLSSEEIASLKQLAAVADKLVSLVNTSTDEDEIEDEEEIEEIEDEEEEQIEDEEEEQIEEVIDTSKKKTADSIKKSATAIEKKIKTDDSLDKDAVSDAWAKRYGGNK